MIRKILGISMTSLGIFIILSGFQAPMCELSGKCLGMSWWFSLYSVDNVFMIALLLISGFSLIGKGLTISMEDANE